MRRLVLSVGVVAASASYVGWVESGRDSGLARLAEHLAVVFHRPDPEFAPSGNGSPSHTSAATDPAASPPADESAAHRLHDGVYAGQAYNVTYGIMQVRITVAGGKVAGLDTPYYPKDRYVSAQISYNVLPVLEQEVVREQRTDVDIISGATLTATGYRLSLEDALRQAEQPDG